jgi:H+/Cl- antiporter ClcA
MIAIELLLFEWKPRSFIPVVVASFIAYAVRTAIIGTAPPFLIAHPESLDVPDYAFAVLVGIGGGIVSALMTKLVYFLEDTYERLPVHWMWWPALGAVVVGIGGWFVPAALGVGYGTINGMLNGHLALDIVLGIIIVKIVIWSTALSSGTSGGVLAPLLMIGAATGTLFAAAIPGHQSGAWAAIGMAAVMGGTMRAPFMATLFTIETTHAWVLLPPVFVGCMAATAFTVVFVPRSILTEKLARRGTHVSREYSVHPLELIAVERVMEPRTDAAARPQLSIAASERVRSAATLMAESDERELAVVDDSGEWIGTVTLDHLLRAWRLGLQSETQRVRVRKLRFLSAAWRR